MKLSYFSDVHCEFHKDNGKKFLASLPSESDVTVIAGDLCSYNQIESSLEQLSLQHKQVVYVLGNHEYYNSSLHGVRDIIADCEYDNVHILNNSLIEINGRRILGTPLWFQNEPENVLHHGRMSDFQAIEDFSEWVYEENFQARRFLENNLKEGDVVVTHYLPSYASIDPLYKSSDLNRFFVCNMEELILDTKPSVWVHGHTHSSVDYMLGDTRVVCNPFGYSNYQTNRNFSLDTLIQL